MVSYAMVDKSEGVIVDWKVETVTEEREPGTSWGGWLFKNDMLSMSASDSRANCQQEQELQVRWQDLCSMINICM